ncbi:telomerase-binding protein EST1A isoform X3 [Gambusia affinis]|uniref:telomerase-binding protein EST1A isoform X3 n=1 Tax=Gambusia affinis TaxID=33528 RepID=UPI001CDD30E0|nr:telomerase-binding protein EST1A isoform X3 [Gambusia affinis]
MANELDRVRISAAELRAEATNSLQMTDCLNEEQRERKKHKQHKQREAKRPDLQRYQPAAGHGRCHQDSEEGETGQRDSLDAKAQQSDQSSMSGKNRVSEDVLDRKGCTDLSGTKNKDEDRMRGDGSNSLNCKQGTQSLGKTDTNSENDKEQQDASGAPKPAKKVRKPDREFYQPGSRRNVQGKDCSVGKELDKPSPKKQGLTPEPESQLSVGEGNSKKSIPKHGGKDKVKFSDSNEETIEQGRQTVDQTVEKIMSKVERLNIKEKGEDGGPSNNAGDIACTRREKESAQGGETKCQDEKTDRKEKGSRRRRGGEKEKKEENETHLESKRDEEANHSRKNNQRKLEKEKDKRAPNTDRRKSEKPGEPHHSKRNDNPRENHKIKDNNSNFKDTEKAAKTGSHRDRVVEERDRHRSNLNATTPNSKRYSKSNIRHSRNRTYSSSSASSVTSQDGPKRHMGMEGVKWPRLPGQNNKELGDKCEGPRRHSSTESLDRSEVCDREGADRRRRRRKSMGKEEISAVNRGEEWKMSNKSGGRGILRVSLDNQSPVAKDSPIPRGRGRGILVLPARTDISNSPEMGQRLFSSGTRGGAAGRTRGGRGGGVRRLWDPNNPDQKPALTNTQSSKHAALKQPLYLQSGTGYGQLHFLDTDDELAGSPPVAQGDHFQSQQATAMAYYKFQNSDNPYCYPIATNSSNSTTGQRYPYQYNMGQYQMAHPNGMYPSPGTSPFSGSYRGAGYSQPGIAGGLTFEEELGRMLKAADAHELQLSNLISRDRVSADGLDRMSQLRAELLGLYERIILADIEFSDSQSVDQALWKNVFYQVIERFRQLLKDPSCDNTHDIRNMLLTLLDEGALFFDTLLQKLQAVYQFTLEDYMDGMAIRTRPLRKTVKYALISAQRCMICQGDIARYREQATNSANYGKARSWYLKAQQIAPKNGRPYNQLALLAVYTKRKLDAVYYYMRSLAASNPILTAKESLMSLFEEAKRKAEQFERRRRQEQEGGSQGPAVKGRRKWDDGTRVETWIRPSGQTTTPSSQRGGSESSRDSEQDGELGSLTATELNKRFILSFLHAHGKLFTKVGMESFPEVASRVLQEFKTLLQHGPSLLGFTNLLQIITINMFAIYNAHSRGEEGDVRSVLLEQSTALGLDMFALLVQRCTELLKKTPAAVPMTDGEEEGKTEELQGMVRVSAFPLDLRELLPGIKVWSDWMLGHPEEWNPPPCSLECSPDVWQCLADLCNALARVDHEEMLLYKVDTDEGEGDEELTVLQLKEDKLLAGFVPLLAAPQEPCYTDKHTDMAIAADCKRVTVLKYFLEALCGQEEPLLAFKGGKYVSVATSSSTNHSGDTRSRQNSLTEKESDDVILEAESSLSGSEEEEDFEEAGESENDIKELKARRHALANKLAQQQKRRDKIQAVLQTGGQLELEVRPLFLVPDTNCFIDHLDRLKNLLQCGTYIIVVPLIVITELDGLAKGQEPFGGAVGTGGRSSGSRGNYNASVAHMRAVQEQARSAVAFLEKGFEAREPCLRALTSRGNQLESIAFRSEDTSGQQGNNDDVILSCCLHYCKDKAKDFMPPQRTDGTVRLQREVVLLTDDRNLRVKALTRNVPVRDIPSFLSWAKVG